MKTVILHLPFFEPHRPPIAPAILAEISALEGHEVIIEDINIKLFNFWGTEKFHQRQTAFWTGDKTKTVKELIAFFQKRLNAIKIQDFDWILVTCFSQVNIEITKIICRLLREITKSKIVIGGAGLEDQGNNLLQSDFCDYWIKGEGEIALRELFRGNIHYPGINNIPPAQIENLEDIPLPNWKYLDLYEYDYLLNEPDLFVYGSRGCVRSCAFCDVPSLWPKFRWRSGKHIAEEIIKNYETLGVSNIYMTDSLINGNQKEFRILLEVLAAHEISKKLQYGGCAIIRPKKSVPAELFDLMAAAGKPFWIVGVETGSNRIRESMGKKFTNDDVDWHLEQSQRIGLKNTFLMISTWWNETPEEHEEYLQIFPRWQPYAVDGTIASMQINHQLNIMSNTPLSNLVSENQIIMNTNVSNPFDWEINHLWHNPKMPDLTILERVKRAYQLYKTAMAYNFPLYQLTHNLKALESILEKIEKNEITSGLNHKSKQKIIPISSIDQ